MLCVLLLYILGLFLELILTKPQKIIFAFWGQAGVGSIVGMAGNENLHSSFFCMALHLHWCFRLGRGKREGE
jgi:hypothetical protein